MNDIHSISQSVGLHKTMIWLTHTHTHTYIYIYIYIYILEDSITLQTFRVDIDIELLDSITEINVLHLSKHMSEVSSTNWQQVNYENMTGMGH